MILKVSKYNKDFYNKDLKPLEHICLTVFKLRCFNSFDGIDELLNTDIQQVNGARRGLIKKGYITKSKQRGGFITLTDKGDKYNSLYKIVLSDVLSVTDKINIIQLSWKLKNKTVLNVNRHYEGVGKDKVLNTLEALSDEGLIITNKNIDFERIFRDISYFD